MHILSQPVQEELATTALDIETSTLDVERKHNLDRRSEAPRVASVAKASRGAFVRQWRADSCTAAPTAKACKELRKHKCANKASVALEKHPELFPPSHGKLWHETSNRKRQTRLRPRRPLERFREYLEKKAKS